MEEKIWIAFFKSFLRQLNNLSEDEPDVNIRDELENVGIKLLKNQTSSGLCLEEPVGAVDENMRIVHINDKFSAVLNVQDDALNVQNKIYFMLWVGDHDDAIDWAINNSLKYDDEIMGYQVFDISESDAILDSKHRSLFSEYQIKDLLKIGVPEDLLAFIRGITDETDFYNFEYKIPEYAFINLEKLVLGWSIKNVLDEVEKNLPKQTDDTPNDARFSPITLESFMLINDTAVFREIMKGPVEEWRTFLHPSQRKAAEEDYNGPALVLGRAGTGKTIVAMHRAKFLASKCEDGQKVLVTTFTTNLANDIKENLKKLCTKEEMEKIEVINLDAWVSQFLNEKSFSRTLTYPNDKNSEDPITTCWKNAIEQAGDGLSYGPSFYKEEWEQVATMQEEITRDQYVNADRDCQEIALSRKEREKIWGVLEEYKKQMEDLVEDPGSIDVQEAMHECVRMLKEDTLPKYEHVVVDEGQDFSNNAYRLIRTLAGDEHENDIFIVGDSHQRIYENIPTLSKCGINIENRVTYLTINYRTTEEIQKAASALLDGKGFDDLNGGMDPEKGCVSYYTKGIKPSMLNCRTKDDAGDSRTNDLEVGYISKELKALKGRGVNPSDICITARTNSLVKAYKEALEGALEKVPEVAGIPFYEIKTKNENEQGNEGFRIATMHRLKGLEFQYVFIVSVNDKIIPLEIDSMSKEQADLERNLLYVAMTRAQWGVYLTCSSKKPSEFFEIVWKAVHKD